MKNKKYYIDVFINNIIMTNEKCRIRLGKNKFNPVAWDMDFKSFSKKTNFSQVDPETKKLYRTIRTFKKGVEKTLIRNEVVAGYYAFLINDEYVFMSIITDKFNDPTKCHIFHAKNMNYYMYSKYEYRKSMSKYGLIKTFCIDIPL